MVVNISLNIILDHILTLKIVNTNIFKSTKIQKKSNFSKKNCAKHISVTNFKNYC